MADAWCGGPYPEIGTLSPYSPPDRSAVKPIGRDFGVGGVISARIAL